MNKPIAPGDCFEWRTKLHRDRSGSKHEKIDYFRREADDPSPAYEYERMQVTHLGDNFKMREQPFTFPAEAQWFRSRGLQTVEMATEESR